MVTRGSTTVPTRRLRRLLAMLGLTTLGSLAPTEVATGAPAWRPSVPVEAMPSGAALSFPKIAARPDGCTTVAFERSSTVFAATRPAAGGFSTPQNLGAIAPAEFPDLATGTGLVAAIWEDSTAKIRISTAFGCEPLGPAVTVPGSYTFGEDPVVAIDDAGTTVAVFQAGGSGDRRIYRSERPVGGAPPEPTPFAIPAGTEAFRPRVATNEAGGAAVVFDVIEGTNQLYGARRIGAAGWSTPVRLNEEGEAAVANSAEVAIGPDGSLFAVWIDSGGKEVILATLAPGGEVTRTPLIVAGGTVRDPTVAVDAEGRLAIAWAEEVAIGQARIHGKHREPGAALSPQRNISATTNIGRGAPLLAIDADGRTIVTWAQQASPPLAAQIAAASTREPGSEFFGGELPISQTSKVTSPSDISTDADGNTLAALFMTETPREARVAAFDAAGPVLGDPVVPSGMAGDPLAFSLTGVDAWSPPVATHWDFGDGASANGDSVSHAYGSAGNFAVTATATDALGNASEASGTATIAPRPVAPAGPGGSGGPGGPNGGVAAGPPRLTKLKVRPSGFSVGLGARVTFMLSERARVRFTVEPRHGSFKRPGKAGANRFGFIGRIRGTELASGSYRLRAVAVDRDGNRSKPRTARFRILADPAL